MDSLLASLGGLLISALPTFFLVLILFLYLKVTFFQPLEKALKERREATVGTRKLADESLRRAEEKAAEYEEKLRAARGEIYREQETQRRQWREEQAAAMAAAKQQADLKLAEARRGIDAAQQEAAAALRAESEALAEQISNRILAGGAH